MFHLSFHLSQVLEVETVKLTPELRRRLPFLGHLPLYCDITFLELDMRGFVSASTAKKYSEGSLIVASWLSLACPLFLQCLALFLHSVDIVPSVFWPCSFSLLILFLQSVDLGVLTIRITYEKDGFRVGALHALCSTLLCVYPMK